MLFWLKNAESDWPRRRDRRREFFGMAIDSDMALYVEGQR